MIFCAYIVHDARFGPPSFVLNQASSVSIVLHTAPKEQIHQAVRSTQDRSKLANWSTVRVMPGEMQILITSPKPCMQPKQRLSGHRLCSKSPQCTHVPHAPAPNPNAPETPMLHMAILPRYSIRSCLTIILREVLNTVPTV